MDILNERIMQDGKCFPGGILKVDSFINHQMDPTLMMQIAEEFKRIFDGRNIGKRHRTCYPRRLSYAPSCCLHQEESA